MSKNHEKGAITVAESLIAIAVGLAILILFTQSKVSQMEYEKATEAGHAVAAYARAASIWIAHSPSVPSGSYAIDDLQDCSDPNGERFLPCTYDAQTPIPYAFDAAGNPITFGDLSVEVSVSSGAAGGVIDFGIFRSGDDENGDSLPDSRPDLAAKVLQTASMQSAAGVLSFFVLEFVEDNPAGIILDRSDSGFDQARVDNLSRIRARIGATAEDAPFLRIDGGNEMTGSLVFDNGMQITQSGTGLSVTGSGDVEIQTTTGNLAVAGEIKATSLNADSAEIEALSVMPADGVTGEGFDRFNQAPDIIRIDSDIVGLTRRVSQSESDTQTNRTNIASNAAEISRLTGVANKNASDVTALTASLAQTNQKINTNTSKILSLSDKLTGLPTESACSPSKSSVIAKMRKRGYDYHFDTNSLTGSSGCFGTTCTGLDRCGDTVRGTRGVTSPWSNNPERYSYRDSTSLTCRSVNINFYRDCTCVIPRAPSCK